jgi:hypothetical protein
MRNARRGIFRGPAHSVTLFFQFYCAKFFLSLAKPEPFGKLCSLCYKIIIFGTFSMNRVIFQICNRLVALQLVA